MKYEELTFIKPIGKGAFGTVYLTSKEGDINNYFATKIIKKSIADSPKVKKYFHNEIEILKEIKHKNIMELIEIKQSEENYYLVCELCNGGSLHNLVNKYIKLYGKAFSEEIVQYLMKQIIDALKYLHGLHIIHRDLKLENILVNFKNQNDKSFLNMYGAEVKIIDFGFSTYTNNQDLHKSVLGSPLYMDPIILKKYTKKEKDIKGYNEKIDIWSLGNLCYEMLIGKPCFETNNIKILEQKIEKGFYHIPNTFYKEVVGFLVGMLQYNSDIRLSAEELSRHPFLMKNIRHFERININEMKKYIKNNKLEIGIYEDKYLWNLFNSKYPRFLEIIPEDSDISESIFYKEKSQIINNKNVINGNKNIKKNKDISNKYNNTDNNIEGSNNNKYSNNIYKTSFYHSRKNNNNDKNINNKCSDEVKNILKKAFDKINEDFLIMPHIFVPIIPGNDPNDLFNEEKNI